LKRNVVHGDLEEALDLALVKVHGKHPVGAGRLEQAGHQASRYRLAGGALLVLARVRVVRHHGRDAPCRGQLGGLDHDEQLHDVRVQVAGRRLHEEDVGAADALLIAPVDLAVGERLEQESGNTVSFVKCSMTW
jgi:hypothetical protein